MDRVIPSVFLLIGYVLFAGLFFYPVGDLIAAIGWLILGPGAYWLGRTEHH
jgi:hypothetical protein